MIKITKITIKDTGYNTSDRDGTPKSGTDITELGEYLVNGGNAITLDCGKFSLDGVTNLSADSDPSSNDAAKTAYTTFANELYTIPFRIDVTSSTARDLLKEIYVLRKTKGVKLLYSSDTASTAKMLPEILGRTDTRFHGKEIAATIPVFVCRVKGIQLDNSPSGKYAVTGKLTIVEEKVVKA